MSDAVWNSSKLAKRSGFQCLNGASQWANSRMTMGMQFLSLSLIANFLTFISDRSYFM